MEKAANKFGRFIKTFPRKHHVEYIAALLSIPVLLSVIALNYFNLQNTAKKNEPAQPISNEKPVVIITGSNDSGSQILPTNSPSCKKEIGPISISSPKEGETVSSNPVCISIRYEDENYCAVVWSYRINGNDWSDYNSSSPCLYNLPSGKVKFELRVQSTVSQDEETIERNFIYEAPTATSTATQN